MTDRRRHAPEGRARTSWVDEAADRQGLLPGCGVALFDLDRTLVPGSSLVPFGQELLRRRLVRRRVVARHLGAAMAFHRRGLQDDRIERIRTSLLSSVAGRDHAPLADAARTVGISLAASVYPSARWLMDCHREAGDFCVILTASPHEVAVALADAIGAHRAVGTRLQVEDGRLTGALDGPFCHGTGKLARLEREIGPIDWDETTAYGDSRSDLPVLERAGRAVAINPDRGLQAVATRNDWPILRLS